MERQINLNERFYVSVTIWSVNNKTQVNDIEDGGGLGKMTLGEAIKVLLDDDYTTNSWKNHYKALLQGIQDGTITAIEDGDNGDIFLIDAPCEGFALQDVVNIEDEDTTYYEVIDFRKVDEDFNGGAMKTYINVPNE